VEQGSEEKKKERISRKKGRSHRQCVNLRTANPLVNISALEGGTKTMDEENKVGKGISAGPQREAIAAAQKGTERGKNIMMTGVIVEYERSVRAPQSLSPGEEESARTRKGTHVAATNNEAADERARGDAEAEKVTDC